MAAVPALLAALSITAGDSTPDPRAIVGQALAAVEGDSVRPVAARWAARLQRDPSDRLAQLGLATIARLTYDRPGVERHYGRLRASADPRSDAIARHALLGHGLWLVVDGRTPEADTLLARTQVAARAARDGHVEAAALVGRATTQRSLSGLETALAYADSAVRVTPPADVEQMGRNRCRRSFILGALAHPDAEREAARGALLAQQAGDRRTEALCLRTVAQELENRAQYDSSLTVLRRVVALERAARSFRALASTLVRVAGMEIAHSRFVEARREASALRELTTATHDTLNLSTAHQLLGIVAVLTGDWATASTELDRAVAIARSIGDVEGEMYARIYQIEVLAGTGDVVGARRLAREIAGYFERKGSRVAAASHRRLIGQLALRAGDYEEAERELTSARDFARRHGMEDWATGIVGDFALLALRRGDLRAAEPLLAQQLRLHADGGGAANVLGRYEVHARIAELHARRGELTRAATELRTAGEALDRWRASLPDGDLRTLAFQSITTHGAGASPSVARVLASLAAGGHAGEAFALAEQRRARSLADRLVRGIVLGGDTAARARRVADRSDARLTVAQAGAALPDARTALIEYVTGPDGAPTTVLVVTRDGVRAHVAPPADSLAPSILRLVAVVERGDDARALGRTLGAMLLDRALAGLGADVSRLMVIPDGPLHRVPIDALRLPDGRFVAERYAVSLAPSATVAAELWRRPRPAPTDVRLLALGDPAFAAERTAGDADLYRSAFAATGGLPRLAASGDEAGSVARYASDADVWLRGDASEASLKRAPLSSYRVLHLATHALVDEQSVARTAIALAPGGGEDGFLTPGELAALPLRADLIVLSACRTAGGVVVAGEGVQGLTAPLLAAGARAVVATNWSIGDRSAAEMVEVFYRALARGLPAGDALREAKLDAIRRGRPPREWAAFTVVGDPTVVVPLRAPTPRAVWVAAGAALLAGAGLVVRYSVRTRKARSGDRT